MKRILFMVLAIALLLSAGCDRQPPAPSTEPAGTRPSSTPTETTVQKETEPDLAAASLVSLRQALVETPQQFAVAYLGFLEAENADPVAFIRENVPSLCADLPFLTAFGPEDVVGSRGEIYCVVPAEGTQVHLSHILRDEYGWISGAEPFLDRDDRPFLLLCNDDSTPDTVLEITCSDGSALSWQVMPDHLGFVNLPCDDRLQPLAMDFSAYEALLEREYRTLSESTWYAPAAQELQGTSWRWETWVDAMSMYLDQEIFFEETTAFVRWYDNNEEAYQVCQNVPWSLESAGDAAVLTLDFGGFAGERSYNVLLHDSGEVFFIMANVFAGEPIAHSEALRCYMNWSDLCEAPDPMEMVGTWQRAYFEVEGYREESAPGDATLVVEGASEDALYISYAEKAFPKNNYQNSPMLIELREMYDGCGNSLWVADVLYTAEDGTSYTVTLLSNGLLLLQNYWIMDGAPMVSYEWFERIG